MPNPTKASSGEPFLNSPIGSARNVNALMDMLDWWRRTFATGQSSGASNPLESTSGLVKIKNLTGSDLLRGHYVQLGDYLLDDINHRHHIYEGNLYDASAKGRIAVLFKAAKGSGGTDIVQARILGRCTARVNVTDITHRFAVPDDGAYLLKSAAASGIGDIEILSTNLIVGTGEQEVAVVIGGVGGGGANKNVIAIANAEVPASTGTDPSDYGPIGSGDFTVKLGYDAWDNLYNPSGLVVTEGSVIVAMEIGGLGVIIEAFCPPE